MPFPNEFEKVVQNANDRQWIDSHCHFDFDNFNSDRADHWLLLKRLGCVGLVIPGVVSGTWPSLIEFCREKPWGYALGLHPYFLDQHKDSDLSLLESTCHAQLFESTEKNKLVAIGEFGLDFMLPEVGHAQQIELCRQQFLIADKLMLPVILHIRKAYDEVAAMIRRLGFSQGGVVHGFSGSYQQGMALVGLGFKLGVGGAMSHPRANKLRGTIARLPLSCLALETDAPDMKPAFWQGPDNSPLSLLVLAQMVASLHHCSLDKVLATSNSNVFSALPHVEKIVLF
jgi:TatD DNase family protein